MKKTKVTSKRAKAKSQGDIDCVRLGSVCVDSGTLFIGDPCYLDKWNPDDLPTGQDRTTLSDAAKFITGQVLGPAAQLGVEADSKTRDLDSFGRAGVIRTNGEGVLGGINGEYGLGLVTKTMWGDGLYDVLGMKNDDGQIDTIVIPLDIYGKLVDELGTSEVAQKGGDKIEN